MSPEKVTYRLQRVMNAATWVVTLRNSIVDWRQFYTTSSIGWMSLGWLSTNSVWWCTGVYADYLIPASDAAPRRRRLRSVNRNRTVSLCLAVDSARTAVVRSTMQTRQSETRCLMSLEIPIVWIVSHDSWKQFSLAASSVTSALHVIL